MNKTRKSPRLKNYDYSSSGGYFVTICTKDRKQILSKILVGEGLCALPQNKLTGYGEIVDRTINYINENYDGVTIDKYIIMPNHIHLIIILDGSGGHGNPPLQDVVGQLKSFVTNECGKIIWQRSYHDHIIRNDEDYAKIWGYVDTNVIRWKDDCFYSE